MNSSQHHNALRIQLERSIQLSAETKNVVALIFVALSKLAHNIILHRLCGVERLLVSIPDNVVEERKVWLRKLFRHCYTAEAGQHNRFHLLTNDRASTRPALDISNRHSVCIRLVSGFIVGRVSQCRATTHDGKEDRNITQGNPPTWVGTNLSLHKAISNSKGSFPRPRLDREPGQGPIHARNRQRPA